MSAVRSPYAVRTTPSVEGAVVVDKRTGASVGAHPTKNAARKVARGLNEDHQDRLDHPEDYR